MPNLVPIGRALISVSDKTGLLDLARALAIEPDVLLLDEADEDFVIPHPNTTIGGPSGKAAVLLVENRVLNTRSGRSGRSLGVGR